MPKALITLLDLPPPPEGRTGFPWTEETALLPAMLPNNVPYPRISIVTPSYNQGQYLEETIRSVLLQGYSNLEYVVMDGGSSDDSVSVIEKYAPFLDFWMSERDKGQTDAINKGFARTHGDLMGWLNSDDILLAGALDKIAQAFTEPSVQLVTGLRKNIDEQSHVSSNWIRDIPTDYYILHYCCVAQETTYWRREVWEKLGKLDESLQFAMDYEYWLRAIKRGNYSFHLIPHYLGSFRSYPQNKTNSWIDVYYRDINTLYHRYDMGIDETDVHQRLGRRWGRRYGLYVRLSTQSWTNSPRLVMLAWRVLENPVLCDVILAFTYFYEDYVNLRRIHGHSFLKALGLSLRRSLGSMRRRYFLPAQRPVDYLRWGNLRTIPEDPLSENAQVDTFMWGKGWYSLEQYARLEFRWSTEESELIISQWSGVPRTLCLLVAAWREQTENELEILDQNGNTLHVYPVNDLQTNVQIDIPASARPGQRTVFRFRWHGSTHKPDTHEPRRLAFRVFGIAWRSPLTDLMLAADNVHEVHDSLLTYKTPPARFSFLGEFLNGIRAIRFAPSIMQKYRSLWKEMLNNQAELARDVENLHTDEDNV